jgi:hypothetical protein
VCKERFYKSTDLHIHIYRCTDCTYTYTGIQIARTHIEVYRLHIDIYRYTDCR